MNKTPSILVDTGFEVDQNGGLTEIIFPKVVRAINAPRKVTCEGDTINYMPSTVARLQQIEANSVTTLSANFFKGYNALTTASLNAITAIADAASGASNAGIFNSCAGLVTLNMTSLQTLGKSSVSANSSGICCMCTALTTVNMPKLTTIGTANGGGNNNGHFYGCTSLTSITLPQIISIGAGTSNANGHFAGCTSLESVQFGSEGHPVNSIGNYTFGNCTQSGLTITVYTTGGAALSGEPWGATNADIEYEEA